MPAAFQDMRLDAAGPVRCLVVGNDGATRVPMV
jgi:hypothetical protein